MTNRMIPILVAALFASACMTAAQKKDKSDAETAVTAASAAVASAKQGGGEAYSAIRMRSAESDARLAEAKLKAGDWEEAKRYARLASGVAVDLQNEAEAARKSAAKSAPLKSGPFKKKTRTSTSK